MGAEKTTLTYMEVADDFGLTVSVPKTKLTVCRFSSSKTGLRSAPKALLAFAICLSTSACSLPLDMTTDPRYGNSSTHSISPPLTDIGFLSFSVIPYQSLSTKRKMYNAYVLTVLLYGSETWTLLRKHLKRLDGFHRKCVHTVLRITNHITSESVREKWGDLETITSKVTRRRIEWLGHLARMLDELIPKKILFGWLPKTRPTGGPRKRWRDHIRKDLKLVGVSESDWYSEATRSRKAWRAVYRIGLGDALEREQEDVLAQADPNKQRGKIPCQVCKRTFKSELGIKRHKCLDEKSKPVCEQCGAVKCDSCI